MFIYFGFVNEREHSIIRNWHSWKTSANRSICDAWMLNPITERGLNTNPLALVIEIMQDSFICIMDVLVKKRSGRSKKVTPFTNVGFGAVAIVFAIVAFISPILVSEIPLTLLSVAMSVMFNGFARITQGAFDRSQPRLFRAFSIGIGVLSIGASIFVTNSKLFGIGFPIRTLFTVLLLYGIGMIVYGATGKLSLDEILKRKIRSKEE